MHGTDNFKVYQIQVISESIRSNNEMIVSNPTIEANHHHHHHHRHHHISVLELGHLLTRSGLTYQEVQVQRLKVAILPLDIPCCGPLTHSGDILTTGKSHGKKPYRSKCRWLFVNVLCMCTIYCVSGWTRPHLRLSARVRCWAADVGSKPHTSPVQRKLRRGTALGRRTQSHQLYQLCKMGYLLNRPAKVHLESSSFSCSVHKSKCL